VARAEAFLHAHFILIHPTVWPQYTNVTDRQAGRQRSDSIGRTILQTVTQKVICVCRLIRAFDANLAIAIMVALRRKFGHYIFALWFLSFFLA